MGKKRTRIVGDQLLQRAERPSGCDEEPLIMIESLDFVVLH